MISADFRRSASARTLSEARILAPRAPTSPRRYVSTWAFIITLTMLAGRLELWKKTTKSSRA